MKTKIFCGVQGFMGIHLLVKACHFVLSAVLMVVAAQSALALDLARKVGDFESILNSQSQELTVWQLPSNLQVQVIDFPDPAMQGRMFNRITQLTEQFSEPYKRVLSLDEMRAYYDAIRRTESNFAYGHDILGSEFALFFNLLERDKLAMTQEEEALRAYLLEEGVLREWRGIYQAAKPDQVIVTVAQTREKDENGPKITLDARRAVLLHELAHGEYYTNRYYAEFCRNYWNNVLSGSQRGAFENFLSKYNYSLVNRELLVNEMQAYLMFTPEKKSFSAEKLGVEESELAAMRSNFVKAKPPTRLPMIY